MLIIGMMVIALICLAVGLALPSSAWLIASLIATAGSGYLVWKMRGAIAPAAAGPGHRSGESASGSEAAADWPDADRADRDADRDRADDRDAAESRTTVIPAVRTEDDATSRTTVIPAVRPEDDAASRTTVIPAVPPATAPAARTAAPMQAPAGPDEVWVIDGRPRYHLGNCPIIQGQDAEPIPFDQAVEDGFMPCSLCEPNYASAAR